MPCTTEQVNTSHAGRYASGDAGGPLFYMMQHRRVAGLCRRCRSWGWSAAAVALIAVCATAVHAQGPQIVRGVVRDSASGQPLAGALVELRSATDRATDRTDEEGNFRIPRVAPGSYELSVLRIGFAEARRRVEVGSRDPAIEVRMRPIPQRLSAFRVRGDISAIYGMVGTLPDLLPLAGARVQVIGADTAIVTDSTGGFFIPVKAAGQYFVRMTHDGYAERFFPIEVPSGRAVDGSRLLDPGVAPPRGLDVLFTDLDHRMRQRAASNAAVVPGAEIRKAGATLIDGLRGSPSFASKGLRIVDSACVFVNGLARPGVSLEAFRPEEIEAVEVYGEAAGSSLPGGGVPTGDRSRTLAMSWPARAPCGRVFDRSFLIARPSPLGSSNTGKAFFVVVWLRK